MLSYYFLFCVWGSKKKNLLAGARLLQIYEMRVGVANKGGWAELEFSVATKQICFNNFVKYLYF